MYEYSMEHHTDWVNDIVLVNSGKHSKLKSSKYLSRRFMFLLQFYQLQVMQQLNCGMHRKEPVCQHYEHIRFEEYYETFQLFLTLLVDTGFR